VARQVSLTVEVVDELIGLYDSLGKAAALSELPPEAERDQELWRRAVCETSRQLKARAKARHNLLTMSPASSVHLSTIINEVMPTIPPKQRNVETIAKAVEDYRKAERERESNRRELAAALAATPEATKRRQKAEREGRRQAKEDRELRVRKDAECRYRQLDPAIAADDASRAQAAKQIADKVRERLKWHRPSLKQLTNTGDGFETIYQSGLHPGYASAWREAAIKDLGEIRFKLEQKQPAAPGDPAAQGEWKPYGPGDTLASFTDRLLAAKRPPELTPRELALLEAHLKRGISLSQVQRERQQTGRSKTCDDNNRLKVIRDYNRSLLAHQEPPTAEPPRKGKPNTGGNPNSPAPPKIRELHAYALQAMQALKATNKCSRKAAKDIAKATVGEADESKVKEPLADLARWGYAGSVQGRNGGSWITKEGKVALRSFRKSEKQ
jgi:site-specific DNA-cytosine methylase